MWLEGKAVSGESRAPSFIVNGLQGWLDHLKKLLLQVPKKRNRFVLWVWETDHFRKACKVQRRKKKSY